MKHYQQRIETDLAEIRDHMAAMADRVQDGLKAAVRALLTGDKALAYQTILADHHINRDLRRGNRQCNAFVARHLPSASMLRRIMADQRLFAELERIGDYAVTICRETAVLSAPPEESLARDIDLIAEESRAMLRQAIEAVRSDNAELAKGTMMMADQIERTFGRLLDDLFASGEADSGSGGRSFKDNIALFVVASHLERVSDQAKNICEETVFTVTGEEKPKKVYHILFLEQGNAATSQMAEAMARKAFPNSGSYSSAGSAPAAEADPVVAAFMRGRGVDIDEAAPKAMTLSRQGLMDQHVIVSLDGPVANTVDEVPFHTVALEWSLPVTGNSSETNWEEVFQALTVNIHELMETLRGEGAD